MTSEEKAAYLRSYRAGNRERLAAFDMARARDPARKAAKLAGKRRSYAINRAKVLEKQRQRRIKHPDLVRAISRASAKKHAARARVWRKKYVAENRLQHRAHRQNRRARETSTEGRFNKTDIDRFVCVQNGRCAMCFGPYGRYHIDHIVPLARGGSNWPSNLQLLCKPCNLSKGAKDPFVIPRSILREITLHGERVIVEVPTMMSRRLDELRAA